MKKFNKSKVLSDLYDFYNVKNRTGLINAIENNSDINVKLNHCNKLLKCSPGMSRIVDRTTKIKDLNLLYKNYQVDNKRDLLSSIENTKNKKPGTRLRHINKLEKTLDNKERQAILEVKKDLHQKVTTGKEIQKRLKEKYQVKKFSELKDVILESKNNSNIERVNRKEIPTIKHDYEYSNFESYVDIRVNGRTTEGVRTFTVGLNEKDTAKLNDFTTNYDKLDFINNLFFVNTSANKYLEIDDWEDELRVTDISRFIV